MRECGTSMLFEKRKLKPTVLELCDFYANVEVIQCLGGGEGGGGGGGGRLIIFFIMYMWLKLWYLNSLDIFYQ